MHDEGALSSESGLSIDRVYGPEHLEGTDLSRIGAPGEYPFTRGNHPGGYRDRLWTFRQYSGFGNAEWSNERYKLLLEQGGTGLSVAADLPTQIGYDSDDPEVEEEVGRVGVALDSLADAEILFRGHPARSDLDLVDGQRDRGDHARLLRRRRRQAGRAPSQAPRHDPERHPEGVRRSRHLDLAADAFDPADRRHDRVLRRRGPPLQRGVRRRSPLPRRGSERCAGDGLHAPGRRHLLRRDREPGSDDDRPVRPAGLLLLLHAQRLLRGGRQVPGRSSALGGDRPRALRRHGGQLVDVPHGHGLRRLDAPGTAAPEQHRASRLPGDGSSARRRAVDVHRSLGRALRAPHGGEHHPGAAHPADPGARDRRHEDRRPARWLLLRRVADRPDGGVDQGDHGRSRGARGHGPLHRGRLRPGPHRRRVSGHPAQDRQRRACHRRGQQVPDQRRRTVAGATGHGRERAAHPARPPRRGQAEPEHQSRPRGARPAREALRSARRT